MKELNEFKRWVFEADNVASQGMSSPLSGPPAGEPDNVKDADEIDKDQDTSGDASPLSILSEYGDDYEDRSPFEYDEREEYRYNCPKCGANDGCLCDYHDNKEKEVTEADSDGYDDWSGRPDHDEDNYEFSNNTDDYPNADNCREHGHIWTGGDSGLANDIRHCEDCGVFADDELDEDRTATQGPGRFNSADEYARKRLGREGYEHTHFDKAAGTSHYKHKDTGATAHTEHFDVSHSDRPHVRIHYHDTPIKESSELDQILKLSGRKILTESGSTKKYENQYNKLVQKYDDLVFDSDLKKSELKSAKIPDALADSESIETPDGYLPDSPEQWQEFIDYAQTKLNELQTFITNKKLQPQTKLDPKMKKVTDLLSYEMIVTITPNDIANGEIEFYFFSPKRLVVREFDTARSPEVFFKEGGKRLKKLGFNSIKDLALWLKSHGAEERKKPKPFKAGLPYYD